APSWIGEVGKVLLEPSHRSLRRCSNRQATPGARAPETDRTETRGSSADSRPVAPRSPAKSRDFRGGTNAALDYTFGDRAAFRAIAPRLPTRGRRPGACRDRVAIRPIARIHR